MEGRIDFEIYGDGNERVQLQKCLEENQISNITIYPPVSQQDLRERYIDADVLFLHLNDYDAFKKVIPSKLFEYGATGKPIWAGLAGYPAEFARSEIMNCAIFHPCHTDEGVEAFNQLKLEMVDRPDFKTKYHRQKISLDFAKDILSLL